MKFRLRLSFLILLLICLFGVRPWRAFAQAGTNFNVKLGSTNGLNLIDTSVLDGQTYFYQVTAYCPPPVAPATTGPCGTLIGESTPLTTGPAAIPPSGTHTVTIAWGASLTAGAVYNVYRAQAVPPNPPVAPVSGGMITVN